MSRRIKKYKKYLGVLPVLAFLCLLAGMFVFRQTYGQKQQVLSPIVDCSTRTNDFDCWGERYKAMVQQQSPQAAFADIKQAYERHDFVRSQCHQIVHVLGREAAVKYSDTVSAYDQGDNFCWSGYYHGVMEGVAAKIGPEKLMATLPDICAGAKTKQAYGFYHYNCVHGLGHGLMAVNSNKLFEVLDMCKKFTDSWERESCYGGTFMENIMGEENKDNHPTVYFKADDALYPCTVVSVEYKQQCYMMQTSHALKVTNSDFSRVFALCAQVEKPLDETCYQSLGRDASGRSISNAAVAKTTCLLGPTQSAQSNCIIGAVKDFVSYYHSDKQGQELCHSLDQKILTETCLSAASSIYSTF